MSKFNIGDKVTSKGYPYLGEEVGVVTGIDLGEEIGAGKYLVKFDSLDICSGWACGIFRNDPDLIIEPYEGYAEWVDEDDLVKVEDKCEKGAMREFNIGDKVFLKNYNRPKGEVVGIDLVNDINKYLVKSDSLGTSIGWTFEEAKENFDETLYNIIYYEGYAIWTNNIEKIEEVKEKIEETIEDTDINNIKGTSHFIKVDTEKEFEDYILDEYKKLREQKKETIKDMEAEIEKIRKEWNL